MTVLHVALWACLIMAVVLGLVQDRRWRNETR